MKISFIFPWLLSHHIIKSSLHPEKIILTNIVSKNYDLNKKYIDEIKSLYSDLPLIEFDVGSRVNNNVQLNGIPLSLHRIYNQIEYNHYIIPIFHQYDKFHYQFIYSPSYSSKIQYNEFCLLEENLADILINYINDTRNIRFIFIFGDSIWFHDNSFLSFLTTGEHFKVVRYYFKDLEHDLIDPVFSEYKIFLWNIYKKII